MIKQDDGLGSLTFLKWTCFHLNLHIARYDGCLQVHLEKYHFDDKILTFFLTRPLAHIEKNTGSL
jgi:hypothetical protein